MHYGSVVKYKRSDGQFDFIAWQKQAASRKDFEKHIQATFPESYGGLELVEIIDAGECEDSYEATVELYEAACIKADKLSAKAKKPAAPKEEKKEPEADAKEAESTAPK
jgi:hypothetical protein